MDQVIVSAIGHAILIGNKLQGAQQRTVHLRNLVDSLAGRLTLLNHFTKVALADDVVSDALGHVRDFVFGPVNSAAKSNRHICCSGVYDVARQRKPVGISQQR
ncbi:MAG: hypothetical protein ABWY66_10355, partial [Xanthobacteraceae bacterium]